MESTAYENAKSWPFVEARKLLDRASIKQKGYALLESGYGPSGLPHIGTFGEVARTTYVKHAFECLTGMPAKIFAFSDDRDGLRKVPDNIPQREMVEQYLNFPLTDIPDPFGCHASFGEHNNCKLIEFLDAFGFDYEFQSATYWYRSGKFNEVLLKVLAHHREILDIMLASLREERAATYSPFLPISPKTGRVLQVPVKEYRVSDGTIVFQDEDGTLTELPVTDGHCKLQWKVDWAARWVALGVDYEMAGKDLIDSVKLSSKICKVLGGTPPEGFNYELFLDEHGSKISKSKGNGLSMEDWLRYAPQESLANFMFGSPKSAKKLYFGVIPRQVDMYVSNLQAFTTQTDEKKLDNPVWHIHNGNPPHPEICGVSFSLLLNLASVCNTEDKDILWGFVKKYRCHLNPASMKFLDLLIEHAINYYQDFVKPCKNYATPSEDERAALVDLRERLINAADSATAEELQAIVFEVGKAHNYTELRDWFNTLYRVLFGQEDGPRMGSFIELYGKENFIELIDKMLGKTA